MESESGHCHGSSSAARQLLVAVRQGGTACNQYAPVPSAMAPLPYVRQSCILCLPAAAEWACLETYSPPCISGRACSLEALDASGRRSTEPADCKVQPLDVDGLPARVSLTPYGVEFTYSPKRGCFPAPAGSESGGCSQVLAAEFGRVCLAVEGMQIFGNFSFAPPVSSG